MTDDQIDETIAKHIGWQSNAPDWSWADVLPPRYCRDLNAMHEAEKTLSQEQCHIYSDYLALTPQSNEWAGCTMWHFTAFQRANAFVKTIGKWKE